MSHFIELNQEVFDFLHGGIFGVPQRGFSQHQRKITSARMISNSNLNPLKMCLTVINQTTFDQAEHQLKCVFDLQQSTPFSSTAARVGQVHTRASVKFSSHCLKLTSSFS